MSTTGVRPLATAEWRLYREIRLAALAQAPEAFSSTLAREEAFSEVVWRQRLSGRNQFIAECQNEPCGLVGIIPDGPAAAELVSMWVHPAYRGRGVGGALVSAALDWAHERGARSVRLWVAEGNLSAENLYTAKGFVRTGEALSGTDGSVKEFAMARTVTELEF